MYLPKIARLESCIKCQLKCACCTIGDFYDKNPPKCYFLSSDNFLTFIKNNKFIKIIELSNNGEMFLNPQLDEIIKIANRNRVVLTARNGVNFNDVSDEILESMVKNKFHSMNIAIDGASQKTYSEYRVKGDFNKVINNIKKLNYFKEKYNSIYPILFYQFIIFGHNEHEIPLAKKFAKELKMKMYFKRNLYREYSPIKDKEFVAKELHLKKIYTDDKDESKLAPLSGMSTCTHLWFEPQIQCDGTFLGCCSQYKDTKMNVFESGLESILNSPQIINSKRILCNQTSCGETICSDCFVFNYRMKNKNYINSEMIANSLKYIENYFKEIYIY